MHLSRVVTSKTILLLPIYVLFTFSVLRLKRNTSSFLMYIPPILEEYDFLFVFFLLLFLPRLFAWLTCTWGVTGMDQKRWRESEEHSKDLPYGLWTYVGNPFPECGFLFSGYPFPSIPFTKIECDVIYLQDVTIGGLGMALLHNNSQRNSPLTLETTDMAVVYEDTNGTKREYLLPRIKYPSSGWQSRVRISPSGDPRVWWKSHPYEMIYFWVHDTVKDTPYEEYMILPYSISVLSFCFFVFLMFWSFGLVAFLVLFEVLTKRFQHHLLKRNFPTPPQDFKTFVSSKHDTIKSYPIPSKA